MIMYTNEDKLQADCFQQTWNFFPYLRKKFWHVPNGKKRTAVEAAQLKAVGVVPGVVDIHFFFKGRFVCCEMKVNDNQLSQPQQEWKALIEGEGGEVWEVRDLQTWKWVVWTRVLRISIDGRDSLGRSYGEWVDYH